MDLNWFPQVNYSWKEHSPWNLIYRLREKEIPIGNHHFLNNHFWMDVESHVYIYTLVFTIEVWIYHIWFLLYIQFPNSFTVTPRPGRAEPLVGQRWQPSQGSKCWVDLLVVLVVFSHVIFEKRFLENLFSFIPWEKVWDTWDVETTIWDMWDVDMYNCFCLPPFVFLFVYVSSKFVLLAWFNSFLWNAMMVGFLSKYYHSDGSIHTLYNQDRDV